jgi:mannosyl-glycoprotein endo-beta-N-acetylglucosaminidase
MPSAVAFVPGQSLPREPLANAGLTPAVRAEGTPRADRPGVVAAVRTPLTPDQASALIAGALERQTGEPPSKETVAILTAQWAHETGRGASMFNYNFAGIKGSSPAGLSVMQRTREGYGATERTITDNFRAYRTAQDGADDYVALLQRRFPAALDAAKAGDPAGCVRALKQSGYFTGDEVAYTRSVTQMAREFAPDALDFAPQDLPALPVDYTSFVADARSVGAGTSGAPFVNEAAMSDHILRAALRIMAAPDKDERGAVT